MQAATSTLDLAAVKERQQATWASGDYSAVATLIVSVAERLIDAADLEAGARVLDVATGSGNAAIAAARFAADVIGTDYVESLLERARERAAAERVPVEFALGDVEDIAFAAGSFDAVVSVFGSMFAPDHRRAAAEMRRVTRPGGTIALASWTPDGFIGELFGTVGAFVPSPAGLEPPTLWGTPAHLQEIFGADVRWTHTEETFTFRFASAEAFVEYFTTYYGPTLKAVEAVGERAAELRSAIAELVRSRSRVDGTIVVPSTYLASVGERA